MANSLLSRMVQTGLGIETTAGTAVVPTTGLPVLNKAYIDPGQEFIKDAKQNNIPYPHINEKVAEQFVPTFAPELSFNLPLVGQLLALMGCNASQSGAGPYSQLLIFSPGGRQITVGDARNAQGAQCATVVSKLGQTGSRDVQGIGGVVKEVKFVFGKGRIRVTPTFQFLSYADGVAPAGVYALPTKDYRTRDILYKLGDTPAVLLTEELELTVRSNVISKVYGGINVGGPYRHIFDGWSGEGRFSRPIASGANTLLKDMIFNGGGVGNDCLLYIYTRTMASESAVLAADDFRFTLNIAAESSPTGGDDEQVDQLNFELRYDGTNLPFQYEQATTATQAAWAA